MERRASARNTSGFSDWGGASPQSSRATLPFPPDCERVRAFSRHARKGRGPSVPETANVAPPLRLRAGALPASPVGPAPEFALATAAGLEGFPRTQGTSTGTARAAPPVSYTHLTLP